MELIERKSGCLRWPGWALRRLTCKNAKMTPEWARLRDSLGHFIKGVRDSFHEAGFHSKPPCFGGGVFLFSIAPPDARQLVDYGALASVIENTPAAVLAYSTLVSCGSNANAAMDS